MLRRLADVLVDLADPPLFTLTFAAGGARVTRGQVPPPLFADCADVAAELGLTAGRVHGVRRAGRVVPRFSRDLPAAAHQRLRNVFGVHAPRRP